jgi:hypothetical protein
MLECPYDIINCSWPQPLVLKESNQPPEPEWNAPLMDRSPRPCLDFMDEAWCWVINWSDLFRLDATMTLLPGRFMCGYSIVFRVRMKYSGVFLIVDRENALVRQHGQLLPRPQGLAPALPWTIEVSAGEELEIAQWNREEKEWLWGGAYRTSEQKNAAVAPSAMELLRPYLQRVQHRLCHPEGPPLKVFTNGRTPLRVIVGIYSFILNGYVPSAVYLFGDHQWRGAERELLKTLLPFAQIVSASQVVKRIKSIGDARLLEMSVKHWFIMKAVAALLCPPDEFCFMDDDVLILDRMDDALEAFKTHNLVFSMNYDSGKAYTSTWQHVFGQQLPLSTGSLNAGLYWLRNTRDPQLLASQMQRRSPEGIAPQDWEQGFIAMAYMDESSLKLPLQRYYAPAMNGLPGGILGYDYAHNPCKFASVHFLGVVKPDKPSDGETLLHLAPQLLGHE